MSDKNNLQMAQDSLACLTQCQNSASKVVKFHPKPLAESLQPVSHMAPQISAKLPKETSSNPHAAAISCPTAEK